MCYIVLKGKQKSHHLQQKMLQNQTRQEFSQLLMSFPAGGIPEELNPARQQIHCLQLLGKEVVEMSWRNYGVYSCFVCVYYIMYIYIIYCVTLID